MYCSLETATDEDIAVLGSWFPDEQTLRRWAGPGLGFPFTAAAFAADLERRGARSYALRAAGEPLVGFGQLYERWRRVHLARLVVHPGLRGRGLGKSLVTALLEQGRKSFELDEFSLFVYRNNDAAIAIYRSLGFECRSVPDADTRYVDCDYMVRSES